MTTRRDLAQMVMGMAERLSLAAIQMRGEIEKGVYSPEYKKATQCWTRRHRALHRLVRALERA